MRLSLRTCCNGRALQATKVVFRSRHGAQWMCLELWLGTLTLLMTDDDSYSAK